MADLIELAERVEAGEDRDWGLYSDILKALIGVDAPDAGRWYGGGRTPLESLDKAVALLERVLPESRALVTFGLGKRTLPEAFVYPGKDGPQNSDARAASPARALLAATLRALSEKGRE